MISAEHAHPWYREPWPWLLMAGPALVVVASMVTVWLAVISNDGLVADDYYKQGLAVNQTLTRDAAAKALGYRARVSIEAASGMVSVDLDGITQPETLVLRIVHPTRPGLDVVLQLKRSGGGVYNSPLPPLARGRWHLILENRERGWRLAGDLHLPSSKVIELAPR